MQFTAHGNAGQQLLQVIDLVAQPAPIVVQSVYFPSPESVNVGLVFGTKASADGSWPLYASGGFGNRIWTLTFTPGAATPITPAHEPDSGPFKAPFIDLTPLGPPAQPGYNDGRAPIYPTGLAISASGRQLYVANNLGDSVGIVDLATGGVRGIPLADPSKPRQFIYPYDVRAIARPGKADKVFVSCWNDSTVAVVDPARGKVVAHIPVGAHPNAMLTTGDGRRLLVASANSDTVSVIDTASDREVERIAVGLSAGERLGGSAQALALSDNERALFVADAQTASVAVVQLGADALGPARDDWNDRDDDAAEKADGRSRVAGYVPTARYPSALAVVDGVLYFGNGKGEPPARPNAPDDRVPADAFASRRLQRVADAQQHPPRGRSEPKRARDADDARACREWPDGPACRSPVQRAVTDHARRLHHQGEPDVRSVVRRRARGRRRHASGRRSVARDLRQQRRGDAAGRRRARTSRRTIAHWRCDSVCSIASS